ncbi:intein [Fictibacillus sp. BK138]|nr:intein [Fictibacillus sp. BK138]
MLIVLISLVGCNNEKKLVRVDYQISENHSGEHIITDEDRIQTIASIFEKVKWENVKVEMSRKEDMQLTFFYQYDPNEPERLEEYKIWFNKDMDTEIVDPNKHRYGKLDEADAVKLREAIK